MKDPAALPASDPETAAEPGKKKKKDEKMEFSVDKMELALYRARLAMVRTAVTTTTLGFALFKLLEEKVHDGHRRPVLEIFTPRMVALVLFFTGFLGLSTYYFRHVAALKKIGRFTPKFYFTGVMLVSYVILLLTFLPFMGTLIHPLQI
ncbi:MAG TPA: hypothetical protein VK907_11000 [Phnomibacter sp.]|nr:hypothetical protein [Phnomibacter sp.]